MPVKVLIDANVLYRTRLRELVIAMGGSGLFYPLWSRLILDECIAALVRNAALSAPESGMFGETRGAGDRNFLVEGFDVTPGRFGLPDPDDEHVLAAALHAGASAIVTFNLRDFPRRNLAPHGIEAWTPDALFRLLLESDPPGFHGVLQSVREAIDPTPPLDAYIAMLRRAGLGATVKAYVRRFENQTPAL